MVFRFCYIRQTWISLIAAISMTCITLSLCVAGYFTPKSCLWIMICIPGVVFFTTVLMLLPKRGGGSNIQSVTADLVSILALTPFVTSLAIFSGALQPDLSQGPFSPAIPVLFRILQALTWITFGLTSFYSIFLSLLSVLAYATYDKSICIRDVTTSPSPFPLPFMLKLLFRPALRREFAEGGGWDPDHVWTSRTHENLHAATQHHCMPGCTCDRKLQRRGQDNGEEKEAQEIQAQECGENAPELTNGDVGMALEREGIRDSLATTNRLTQTVSVHTLVRPPSVVERLSVIRVGFQDAL